jgi:hypothetical protein
VHGVAVVVDVRLALVLPGQIDMRLMLVGDGGMVVPVGVSCQLVLRVAAVPQVVGHVRVPVVVDDRVVVMRIHAELPPAGFRTGHGRLEKALPGGPIGRAGHRGSLLANHRAEPVVLPAGSPGTSCTLRRCRSDA